MAHGWSPDVHEVVIGTIVAVSSGTFLWLLRRVRTNDIHTLEGKIDGLANDIDELKTLNRKDHEKFFDRIGKLETAVGKLNVKVGIE